MDFTFTRAMMKSKKANLIKFESNWSKELKEICTKSKLNLNQDSSLSTSQYLEHNFQLRCLIEMIQVARHIHDLHNEICKKIQASNYQYKIHADTHRRHAKFQVGDYVGIRIRLEWFPSGTVKKLQARSAEPFKVLKQIGLNAYVIDLPHDYGINFSFNIEDLVAYKSPIVIPDNLFDKPLLDPINAPIPSPLPLNLPYAHKESVDAILDEQIVSTGDGGVHNFLVCWQGQPDFDCTWITQDER